MSDAATAARIGTIVDANVHLWDQATNPVFWLSDRTMLVDMLGDYGSLPDRYTLDDYLRAAGPFDIGGVIWSDPGTADPVAAVDLFGCDRCMFGSDMPIETLRSPFANLCVAYDEVLRSRTPQERRQVVHDTVVEWLGTRSPR